ncbi:MAG: ferredoxin [Bdellovibrionota bacterium]
MLTLEALPLAVIISAIILGGPLTLIIAIRVFNFWYGNIRVTPVTTGLAQEQGAPLGLLVTWDGDVHNYKVSRVRLEYSEIFRGGLSLSTSFTFEDKQAKKRSFVLPLKLVPNELKILTHSANDRELKRSQLILEVESTDGRTVRKRIAKKLFIEALQKAPFDAVKAEADMLAPKEADTWAVATRIFPWRKVVEVVSDAPKTKGPSSGGSAIAQIFDFIITKVWIEPGCIVCDACENEAPDVFQVLADTCIVRDAAPLVNTGSIVAAAEGCPVDVIKYDRAAKPA